MPAADKTLLSLLKSYFNLHLKPTLVNIKVIKKDRKKKGKEAQRAKSKPIKYNKLSVYKTFIGKGNIKHTSNKVLLTFYMYDIEKLILEAKIKFYKRFYKKKNILIQILYFYCFESPHFKDWRFYPDEAKTKRLFKRFSDLRRKYLQEFVCYFSPLNPKIKAYTEQYLNLQFFVETMPLTKKESKTKWIILDFFRVNFATMFRKIPDIVRYDYLLKKVANKASLIQKILNHKKKLYDFFYMQKLIYLIEKLYAKKVELNIVNLKYMHYNSDIFTQAVSLKLKNRENKLYRVLKASLRFVKLWPIDKLIEKQKKRDKEKVLINKIRNKLISFMFTDQEVKDPLNSLLIEFFPPLKEGFLAISPSNASAELTESLMIKEVNDTFLFPLKDYVLSTLKHSRLRGIRIEPKGRLTRRFTASRSVFKMKWIGGLKNVDSSFRGFPATMLRGHVKSNVQYSIINSNNRNGAYGVKSWVSSR